MKSWEWLVCQMLYGCTNACGAKYYGLPKDNTGYRFSLYCTRVTDQLLDFINRSCLSYGFR